MKLREVHESNDVRRLRIKKRELEQEYQQFLDLMKQILPSPSFPPDAVKQLDTSYRQEISRINKQIKNYKAFDRSKAY